MDRATCFSNRVTPKNLDSIGMLKSVYDIALTKW